MFPFSFVASGTADKADVGATGSSTVRVSGFGEMVDLSLTQGFPIYKDINTVLLHCSWARCSPIGVRTTFHGSFEQILETLPLSYETQQSNCTFLFTEVVPHVFRAAEWHSQ